MPPFKFRCLDRILEAGCNKIGVPSLPDRMRATYATARRTSRLPFLRRVHHRLRCGRIFLDTIFPAAQRLRPRTIWNCAPTRWRKMSWWMRTVTRPGVAYIDRKTKQEVEVYGSAVVVAASCIESARIMLNSKSRLWPNGIANSSGQLGRNLCDHLYGESARGYLPQLLGQPSFPGPRSRQHHRLDAALAESERSARREIHSRIFGLSGRRVRGIPMASQPTWMASDRRSSERSNGAIPRR